MTGSGQDDDGCNDSKEKQDFLDHVVAGLLDLHGCCTSEKEDSGTLAPIHFDRIDH